MWNFKVLFIAIIISAVSVNDILAYVEVYIGFNSIGFHDLFNPWRKNNRLCRVCCVCLGPSAIGPFFSIEIP